MYYVLGDMHMHMIICAYSIKLVLYVTWLSRAYSNMLFIDVTWHIGVINSQELDEVGMQKW